MDQEQSKNRDQDSVLGACFDESLQPEPSPGFVAEVMAKVDALDFISNKKPRAQFGFWINSLLEPVGWLPAGAMAVLVGVFLNFGFGNSPAFVSTEELILSEVHDGVLFAALSDSEDLDSILMGE